MNKTKILAGLAGILIFGESAGLVYFAHRSQDLSGKLGSLQPGYEKLSQEERELKNKYAASLKESEALKADRDNLITRAKGLLADTSRLKEMESSLERATKDKEALEKGKQEVENYNFSLKEELKKLQDEQKQTIQDRDHFKAAYEKSRKDNLIRELKEQISALQKEKGEQVSELEREKNVLESKLKREQKESAQLREQKARLETQAGHLELQLKEYRINYANALKKNKALAGEIKNIPGKFTEMARQNKILIRETAEMHYNLGVFYTSNKEYERAIAEFEKVVEITPDDAYAHFNLGYIYAEYLVNRRKAIENFRHYLRLAKSGDKDIDWVKKYLLTWETYEGKAIMK